MGRLEVSCSRQVDLGGTGGHDGAPLVTVGKSVLETWANGLSTLKFFMIVYFSQLSCCSFPEKILKIKFALP